MPYDPSVCDFFIESLNQTITLQTKVAYGVPSTDVANAVATLPIGLSIIKNMFQYSYAKNLSDDSIEKKLSLQHFTFHTIKNFSTALQTQAKLDYLNPSLASLPNHYEIYNIPVYANGAESTTTTRSANNLAPKGPKLVHIPNGANPNTRIPSNKMLLKNDYLRYLSLKYFNTAGAVELFTNQVALLDDLDTQLYTAIYNIDKTLNDDPAKTDNSSTVSYKLGSQMLSTHIDRFIENNTSEITNSATKHPLPFIVGDTIRYLLTIKSFDKDITDYTYEIILVAVDDDQAAITHGAVVPPSSIPPPNNYNTSLIY